uniref:Uncharacterized protein n=1 Tax=Aegilops tauschii subsp. strangulata TaxID=200361 RepID=A0A453GJK1_AEGTS
FLLIELGNCSLPFSSSLSSFYLTGSEVYLGEMDPHGPGGGPGWGGPAGWGPGGWGPVPPGGPGFPGGPGPGFWGPEFGGFFGSWLLSPVLLLPAPRLLRPSLWTTRPWWRTTPFLIACSAAGYKKQLIRPQFLD